MFKVSQLNLPKNFLRLLCSFLKDRTLRVHVEDAKSRMIRLKAGTPQGSCLSPILFSIHVNDMPLQEMPGCQPSQFADDVGMWSTGKTVKEVVNSIQAALVKMESWCKKWRVKLAPSKTNVVLFTKCYRAHNDRPRMLLFNEELTYTQEATFLGVKFNSNLTWEPQIRSMISKAQLQVSLSPLTYRKKIQGNENMRFSNLTKAKVMLGICCWTFVAVKTTFPGLFAR